MKTRAREYKSDFARHYYDQGKAEGKVEGRAQGKAETVLDVLAARGIDVPESVRVRIGECTDLGQLELWVRRAVTADSVDDLFSGD
jgi:hypothetical protein